MPPSSLERLEARTGATISLGLDRMQRLLEMLGCPQQRLPPTVHIAGTNGKGSVSAYLTSIARAAGLRIHRYTSPHLVRFNERILLMGKDISDEALDTVLRCVMPAAETEDATFFETTTAAAFLAFSETPADLLILETGLGGRLDATNVVTPVITAITPVSYDHQDFLGHTLEAIAAEKAGILKPDVPLILAAQQEMARSVIRKRAVSVHAGIREEGADWQWSWEGDEVSYHSPLQDLMLKPSLEGRYQGANAAMAAACAETLSSFLPITAEAVVEGIGTAYWPGRLQRLHDVPWSVPGRFRLWLDGGHNLAAAEALAAWAAERDGPVDLIWGMMRDKDAAGFIRALSPYLRAVRTVPVSNERAALPQELAALIPEKALAMPDIGAAIASLAGDGGQGGDILIAGSLFLAGEVLSMIERRTT